MPPNESNKNELTPADIKDPASESAKTGIVIVDHGSRREESNLMFLKVVELFRQKGDFDIVEPAHMELAEPTITQAFSSCVAQGAVRIVVHPYFLFPGRHWDVDIPNLVAQAATSYPTVSYQVTQPLGIHPALLGVISERIAETLKADP